MGINQHTWKSNIYEDFKSFVNKHDGITKKLQEEYISKTAEILKTYGELKADVQGNTENMSNTAKLAMKALKEIDSSNQKIQQLSNQIENFDTDISEM